MPNFDGEYELRLFYTTTPTGEDTLDHVHTVDVAVLGTPAPGTDFANIDVTLKGGTISDLQNSADEYIALVQPLFPVPSQFLRFELWYAAEATVDFTFIAAYAVGLAGTNVGDSSTGHQMTFTFRSAGGGIMRMQYMEPFVNSYVTDPFPWGAAVGALGNYVIGDNSPFLARDNSRPIAGNNLNRALNKKLFKRRYRNA